jgi:hypothetical protein
MSRPHCPKIVPAAAIDPFGAGESAPEESLRAVEADIARTPPGFHRVHLLTIFHNIEVARAAECESPTS